MKKMSLFMGMIAFISITTSCEQDLQSDTTVNAKSGFDAEATYWNILQNPEEGWDLQDGLSNEEKRAVWTFKYDRYLSENTLNASQMSVINDLIGYLEVVNFDEPDFATQDDFENTVRDQFTSEESDFLVFTLENSPDDINLPGDIATEGCWFCSRRVPGTEGPCFAVNNGSSTPDYIRTVDRQRHGLFGIGRPSTRFESEEACGIEDWYNDGFNMR